ncbi:MAG: hypothetical protein HZA50_03545 [Planctomycetes bacterium]|nr:hypothetical protein [Planctomycetota bacterium]
MKKFVAIFHANLNYAYLIPQNYERVIRASYEVILDTFMKKHPNSRFIFEASGYTIDQMAAITPDVLAKLKAAVKSGQCEFMGAPYSHPLMANIPEEDGRWSCEFAMRSCEKHLGFRPESFWNPECTWMQYVPRAFRAAGVKYLTLDFESYMICNDKNYGWVERNRSTDIGWGGHLPWYDLDPDCKFLHRPFRDIVPGLHGICRSDRLIGKCLGYLRGNNVTLDALMENIIYWSGTKDEGSTVVMADDAEYCGTTGYYYVKHYNDYSRSFDIDPEAPRLLDEFIAELSKAGQMITFKEACEEKAVEEPFFVEDRFAWHRTYASVWGNTPEAKRYDPLVSELRREYKEQVQPIAEADPRFKDMVGKFWFHLTNSANSDGRWPPPPSVTCKFNRDWVEAEIESTRKVLAELKQKVAGLPMPPPPKPKMEAGDGVYGYYFTDKDVQDVRSLSHYELQHDIYEAHKMVDSKRPQVQKDGIRFLKKVFDELDRRDMKGIRPPKIRPEEDEPKYRLAHRAKAAKAKPRPAKAKPAKKSAADKSAKSKRK